MMKRAQKIDEILRSLGYSPESSSKDLHWNYKNSDHKHLRFSVEILERRSAYFIQKLALDIKLHDLVESSYEKIRKRFGKITAIDHWMDESGDIHFLIERPPQSISKDKAEHRSRDLCAIGSIVGWKLRLDPTAEGLSFQVLDAFFIGDFVDHWYSHVFRTIDDIFSQFHGKHFEITTRNEKVIPWSALALSSKNPEFDLHPLRDVQVSGLFEKTFQNGMLHFELNLQLKQTKIKPSMETIEAREVRSAWLEIDQKIVSGKNIKRIADAGHHHDWLVRAAMCGTSIEKTKVTDLSTFLDHSSDYSLIYLTAACFAAKQQKDFRMHLDLVSVLIRQFKNRFQVAEPSVAFHRVASELLGDCWMNLRDALAIRCWYTALESGGSRSRILNKIASYARENNLQDHEMDALSELVKVERRQGEAEKIASRLLEIRVLNRLTTEIDVTENDAFLEVLLNFAPYHLGVLRERIRSLIVRGETARAIALIDEKIEDSRVPLTSQDVSEFHGIVAGVWDVMERKPALALQRFRLALSPPCAPSESVLRSALMFFKREKFTADYERALGVLIEVAPTPDKIKMLEERAHFYLDHGKFENAAQDVCTLLEHGRVQQWYLDVLSGTSSFSNIQKRKLATQMSKADLVELPVDGRIIWIIQSMEVSLEFDDLILGLSPKIFSNGIIPHIPEELLAKIGEVYLRNHSKDELQKLLHWRLKNSRTLLLGHWLEVILAEDIWSEDGVFDVGIIIEVASSRQLQYLNDRFASHLKHDRPHMALVLLDGIFIHLKNFESYADLLNDLLDKFWQSHKPNFHGVLAKIRAMIIDSEQWSGARWDDFILKSYQSGFLDLAAESLKDQIKLGLLPTVREDIVLELAGGEGSFMGRWNYLSSRVSTSHESKVRYLKEAISYFKIAQDQSFDFLQSLSDLAQVEEIDAEELSLLADLSVTWNELSLILSGITRQLEMKSGERLRDLIHLGLRLSQCHSKKDEQSLSLFKNWTMIEALPPLEQAYSMAYFLKRVDQVSEASTNLTLALSSPDVFKEGHLLVPCLELLAKCKVDKAQFASTIQTLTSWASNFGEDQLAEVLQKLAVDWNLAGFDGLQEVFIKNFQEDSTDHLANILLKILLKSERLNSGIGKTLTTLSGANAVIKNQDKWWDIISRISEPINLQKMSQKSQMDFLIPFGLHLMKDSQNQLQAIHVYESMKALDSRDSRYFVPLYSLYEAVGDHRGIVSHLQFILPIIKEDRSILESSPFNFESLEHALKRAEESLQEEKRVSNIIPLQIPALEVVLEKPTMSDSVAHLNVNPVANHFGGGVALKLEPNFSFVETSATAVPILLGKTDTDLQALPQKDQEITDKLAVTEESKSDPERVLVEEEAIDWRKLLDVGETPIKATERLLRQAFANEIEKHIALQAVALISDDVFVLDQWHWPVWRNPSTLEYSLSGSGRFDSDQLGKIYGSSLHKLLRILNPGLVWQYQKQLSITSKIPRQHLVEIAWDHPVIKRTTLIHFQVFLSGLKMKFFDAPGLGDSVFLDIKNRSVHFDARWQMNLPPGVLAYRVLESVNQWQRANYSIMRLDIKSELIPFIEKVRKICHATGLDRVKIALGLESSEMQNFIRSLNKEDLISLFHQNQNILPQDIELLRKEIRLRSLGMILASTLDLVGISESLFGKDLSVKQTVLAGKEFHPLFHDLLKMARQLKF